MKKIIKQGILLFAIMVMFCNVSVFEVSAAGAYMKKMNVSWDLKPKKQITYKNCYAGLGLRKEYAKIVSYKKKSSGSKYKVTMKVKFECIKTVENMSQRDRDRFLEYDDGEGLLGDYNVVVADYKTGKCLYASNPYGVKANCSYRTIREKTFYSSDWEYEETLVDSYATVTVTYPKSYKNLCIGVGGSTSCYGATYADEDYYDGYGTFKRTSFYSKKDKGVMHFMRVK